MYEEKQTSSVEGACGGEIGSQFIPTRIKDCLSDNCGSTVSMWRLQAFGGSHSSKEPKETSAWQAN